MTKKMIALMIIGLLLNLAFYSTVKANDDETTQKVKASVAKIGVGLKSIVKVKLKDGREFTGFIKEISENDFTIEGESGGYEHKILYSEVVRIKGKGKGTSLGFRIAIGVGLIVLYGIYLSHSSDY